MCSALAGTKSIGLDFSKTLIMCPGTWQDQKASVPWLDEKTTCFGNNRL